MDFLSVSYLLQMFHLLVVVRLVSEDLHFLPCGFEWLAHATILAFQFGHAFLQSFFLLLLVLDLVLKITDKLRDPMGGVTGVP